MVSYVCLILAVVFMTETIIVEAGKSSEEMEGMMACLNMTINQVTKCCLVLDEISQNRHEKCKLEHGENMCDIAKCFLKGDGVDGDNIVIDVVNKKLEDVIEKYPDMKNPAARIQKHCFEDRRFEDYPPGDCPAASFVVCTFINSITECPAWKDTDQCQKFAQDAKICRKAIDNM